MSYFIGGEPIATSLTDSSWRKNSITLPDLEILPRTIRVAVTLTTDIPPYTNNVNLSAVDNFIIDRTVSANTPPKAYEETLTQPNDITSFKDSDTTVNYLKHLPTINVVVWESLHKLQTRIVVSESLRGIT